ncbi:hypothetical protein H7I53_17905 [Mycolicibacterium pulveris]|nr:hypothetical protein [Mycolicibacterium pulveris]MCV6982092.1 hypothetical protein [Mycolicibacterium pulveris]
MVTVEGTVTPCAGVLPRGERRTVTVTPELRKWVRRGCVKVVEGSLDPPAELEPVVEESASIDVPGLELTSEDDDSEQPASDTDHDDDDSPDTLAWAPRYEATPPPRNASRNEWAVFLDNHEPDPIPYPPGAGRDELIDRWDEHQAQRADGDG